MLEKLIKKVIEDAEKKAATIIEEAEKELEAMYHTESMVIEKECEEKIQAEKRKIDREMERNVSAFVMEREKELLALKNSFIDEVMKKLEGKFNEHLRKNLKEIILSVCKDIDGHDYIVRVPADADVHIDGVKIEKDNKLKDGFVIVSANWDMVFNWENISVSMEEVLRERIARILGDNGEKGTA